MNDWFEAEQRVERAQRLSESQRWEEALAEISAALAINPHHAIWHAHRGSILEELARWEEAVDAYRTALSLEPQDQDIAVALGEAFAQVGRFGQALRMFERLARQYPDFEPAYCHRIGIYAHLGRHDRAEEMFYLAQAIDDACPHCFHSIGTSLFAREQWERAIYCWQRVLALEPDYAGVNRLIAQARRAQGKPEAAREAYLREIREDPGNTDLLYELAELTLESGELAAATARFTQILELDPDHLESHLALGDIWLRRGRPAQALACFEAIEIAAQGRPYLPEFDQKIGQALLRLSRFNEAKKRLIAAVEDTPDNIQAHMLLGETLLAMKNLDDAADAFRRVLAWKADHAAAHQLLGTCLFRQGSFAAGLDHVLEAARLDAGYAASLAGTVLDHLPNASWGEARRALQNALAHHTDHRELRRLAQRLWYYRLRDWSRRTRRWIRRLIHRESL